MKRWLVPESDRHLANDRYHPGYKPGVIQDVEAVIVHYTGSSSPSSTLRWLIMDDEVFVSVHFIVERDGTIKQLIPLDERGAHAGGRSSKLFGKGNVNGRTIGIEIMNVGPLQFKDGEPWTTGKFAKRFKGPGVNAGGKHPGRETDYPHTSWEAYSPAQLDAVVDLLKQLAKEFPILGTDPTARITGHENVDPTRKMDPGPAFPWDIVRKRVFEVEE